LALLRAIAETETHAVTRRLQTHGGAFYPRLSAIGAFGPEHQPRRLGATRAEQASKADDLAMAQFEIERRDISGLAVILETGANLARLALAGGSPCVGGLGQLPAEHHPDQLEPRQRGDLALADQAAIAQDGDAIGDLIDLIEEMADEHDADAALG